MWNTHLLQVCELQMPSATSCLPLCHTMLHCGTSHCWSQCAGHLATRRATFTGSCLSCMASSRSKVLLLLQPTHTCTPHTPIGAIPRPPMHACRSGARRCQGWRCRYDAAAGTRVTTLQALCWHSLPASRRKRRWQRRKRGTVPGVGYVRVLCCGLTIGLNAWLCMAPLRRRQNWWSAWQLLAVATRHRPCFMWPHMCSFEAPSQCPGPTPMSPISSLLCTVPANGRRHNIVARLR